MRHCYKSVVAYNAADNIVTAYRELPEDALFDGKASDEAFYDVYMSVDRVTNMILGISIGGDLYQLSPAGYGTYVKEDSHSAEFINKSKMLVALADYQKKNKIPFSR